MSDEPDAVKRLQRLLLESQRSYIAELEAQLDSMTTEWGWTFTGDHPATESEVVPLSTDEASARMHTPSGAVVLRRLVGPWVEVSS